MRLPSEEFHLVRTAQAGHSLLRFRQIRAVASNAKPRFGELSSDGGEGINQSKNPFALNYVGKEEN
jgi:hypothetical protein